MGRSSSRNSARTCPRCAALLLTDATSCGICRFDLTAPAPPVEEPAAAASEHAEAVAEPAEAIDETIEATDTPTTPHDVILDAPDAPVAQQPESPAAEAPVVDAPVFEAPAAQAPVFEAPVADAPVFEAPAFEAPVFEAPVADAPVFEAPAFEAPVFEAPVADAPVFEAPIFATEPATGVIDAVVVEDVVVDGAGDDAVTLDPTPNDEPTTHAPTHASAEPGLSPEPVVSHTLFSPVPFEAPAEPASHDAGSDATGSSVASPSSSAMPVPFEAPAEPYAFGAPAAVARHGRPDPRGVQAPSGLSSAILVLGILRVASLALSIVLAWWAVQQVQTALEAAFTVDASGQPNLDGFGSLNAALATAGFSALVGLISAGLSIAFLVCLMVWTSRARTVAALTSTGEHRFSPTWAVLGWIVPFANFVVPFFVLSDLYKSADPKTSQTRGRFSGSVPSEIVLLWVTWVASFVFTIMQFTSRNSSIAAGVGISPFSSLQWVWLLTSIVSVGLMVVVVRRITALQSAQLTAAVGSQQAAHNVADPRFGTEWNDTAPVPLTPAYESSEAPLASSSPVGAGINATQAYEPPPMGAAPAAPLSSSSLDQARINPRDPFSFPPPGQSI